MLDIGLWSLSDEYEVIVANARFDEAGDVAYLLKRMQGRQIHLPSKHKFWPGKIYLAWHRREHKLGS